MKQKTQKAIIKRVKITPTGKILRVKAAKSHLLTHKNNPPKFDIEVSRSDKKKIKKLAPYL
jgi:large subunit ribosomal protein L35